MAKKNIVTDAENQAAELEAPVVETEEVAVAEAPAEAPVADEAQTVAEAPVAEQKDAEDGSKKAKRSGGAKEWFRKFIVKLKRKPQNIPLVVTLITSVVYLCMIGVFSQMVEINSTISGTGISMFVNTLASILILPLFLNAFPKRKKPNVVYIVLVFVVYALLIGMDVLFLVNMVSFFPKNNLDITELYTKSFNNLIGHMVCVGVCALIFALLPAYKIGLQKINTKKDLQENNFSGEIDTSAEV